METWICDRCNKICKYEDPNNLGIWLSYNEEDSNLGKITTTKPYYKVCDVCGGDIEKLTKACSMCCESCQIITIWGLSIMECLKFREMYNLLDIICMQKDIANREQKYSKEFIKVFKNFEYKFKIEKLKNMLISNNPDFDSIMEEVNNILLKDYV